LRAYYQITADLQPQFATAGSVDVGYLSGASFVDLKQAIIDNVDFSNPRLRILYDNGLEIYANHNDTDWVYSVAGVTFTIPKDGWVAYNSQTGYLNFSAQPAGYGYRFDYVVYPGKYEMIDGRGASTSYGSITGTDLKIVWENGYTVEETGTFPLDFTITGTMPTPDAAEAPDPLPRPLPNDASVNFRHLPGLYMWFYRAYDDSITVPADRPFWSRFNRYPELDFDESTNRYFYRYEPTVTVSANTMHPGNSVDAVRGWLAYAPGQVRITGNVAKQGGYTGGNGAEARIRDDFEGAILWQQTIAANDTTGYDIDLLVPVGTGDMLLFEVDALGDSTDDTVAWAPVITYVDPPEAEFSAQPRVGGAPLAVQFTDESQGQVDTWEWDFGDLGTSFAQNPSHIYVSPGSYEVTLTVTGPTGQGEETKENFIHVLGQTSGVMIKNQGGAVAAAFTPVGDLLLKGTLSAGASPSPSGGAGELVIKNGSGQVVALISPSGDVEIAGAVNELQEPPLSPASSAFVVKDGTGKVVSYIDSAGNLYLLGGLVEGWL
jgi:PKD repeat protein